MRQVARDVTSRLRSLVGQGNPPAPRGRGRPTRARIEPLEERVLLAMDTPPVHPLPTGTAPLGVALGQLDDTAYLDMAVLNGDGSLTVALNRGNDTWGSVQTV